MNKIKLILALIFVLFLCVGAKADSLKIFCEGTDAYLQNSDASYSNARNDSCSNYISTVTTVARMGLIEEDGTWYCRRSYHVYNTSTIGNDTTVVACTMRVHADLLDTSWHHFDLCVVKGYYDDSIIDCDFKYGVWCGQNIGGSLNSSGLSIGYISIPLDSIQWINNTGNTYLALRSNDDIDSTSGADQEGAYIGHRSANFSGESYDPYILVWYYPGHRKSDSIMTEGELSPGMITDFTPEFKVFYRDGLAQCDSVWWQVGASIGDSNMWNSDWQNVTDIDSGNYTDEVSYNGSALSRSTWYYLQVKTKNADEGISAWSEADSFRIVADDTVWVALPLDIESGDANISISDLNPTIDFSSWHSGGYAYPLFNPAWRDSFPDSEGGHPVWSFLFIYAEPYCSASSFDSVYDACTCVRDTMRNLWGDLADSLGDEMGTHFHSYWWNGSQWTFSALDSIDTLEFDSYMKIFLYEAKHFGASFRGGWNREDQQLSLFLEQWIPTDFTNVDASHPSWDEAPTAWYPYHPKNTDWQVDDAPHMDRTINRCEDLLSSAAIDVIFDTAAASGKAILACYHHNYESIKTDFENHYERIKAKSDSVGIPFVFKTLTGAVAAYYGWTDTVDPTFNFVEVANDSMRVRTSEVIFQATPYGVTIESDTFVKVEMSVHDDTTWQYSLNTYPYKMIVVATDTCGNVGIDSTGEELAGRRRRMILEGE